MRSMKLSKGALALLFTLPWVASAEDQGPAIQKKLESEYQLTKVTDDKSDIVTAGSVLVLHKDKVLMVAATSQIACMNIYRDDKITASGACKANDITTRIRSPFKKLGLDKTSAVADNAPSTRTWVSGEKFWLTKVEVKSIGKDHGVVMDFFTDAKSDVRYKGTLMIPFGALSPTPDEALKLVAEVVTVDPPSDDDKSADKKPAAPAGGQPAAAPKPPAAAPAAPPPTPTVSEAAPPPLDVPPPPPADPAEVKEGQTPDQVVAALGQPVKILKVGPKQIYTYKDVKITFLNGKVKDIQ